MVNINETFFNRPADDGDANLMAEACAEQTAMEAVRTIGLTQVPPNPEDVDLDDPEQTKDVLYHAQAYGLSRVIANHMGRAESTPLDALKYIIGYICMHNGWEFDEFNPHLHESMSEISKFINYDSEDEEGSNLVENLEEEVIMVESGQIWAGDPCQAPALSDPSGWEGDEDDRRYSEPLGSGMGLLLPTLGGDGPHPVKIIRDGKGNPAEVRISLESPLYQGIEEMQEGDDE